MRAGGEWGGVDGSADEVQGRGRNGASFAREMKLLPVLSAVLAPQSLMSCARRVLERVALGAPGIPAWQRSPLELGQGPCADGAGGDLLPVGWARYLLRHFSAHQSLVLRCLGCI